MCFLDENHYGKVITRNGLFSPTVMLNGGITGSWKKTPGIELSSFEETSGEVQQLFEPEIKRMESFYSETV
ncbi:hypothetical protein SDC9_160806 [bioreactor metagenome]|uniref:Winged helix DNA-binding domain-containing protein n=1 Tax=bioreactor metagenome TaxID=1076179 RepID=A0A645FGF3_9ZZZZ